MRTCGHQARENAAQGTNGRLRECCADAPARHRWARRDLDRSPEPLSATLKCFLHDGCPRKYLAGQTRVIQEASFDSDWSICTHALAPCDRRAFGGESRADVDDRMNNELKDREGRGHLVQCF